MQKRIAIIYQAAAAPESNGIIKPFKEGGYADSGADIAYALKQQQFELITPTSTPAIEQDLDWVFPDTAIGIQTAIDLGANVLWLNTVLYKGHPVEPYLQQGLSVIGQLPETVDRFDDKWVTNGLLKANHLAIPKSTIITRQNLLSFMLNFPYPVVAKPIRGRGSQGVHLLENEASLQELLQDMISARTYGDVLYVEEFLGGEELTVTVMPPGTFYISNRLMVKKNYWALPPVRRFNHQNGIAPYNGTVAVVENSAVMGDFELEMDDIKQLCRDCETAAGIVKAKAPIRIDCRADASGKFYLFDVNMKPNMTGPSRPHRHNQDSLTAIAAKKIGWNYGALINNIAGLAWTLSKNSSTLIP